MTAKPELPIMPFASREAWEAWLEEQHAVSQGVWLEIAKKGSGIKTVTFVEALDVALCYGWIDSQRAGFDGRYFLQRFTPRKSRSKWSQVNREKVARLTEAGRMKPACGRSSGQRPTVAGTPPTSPRAPRRCPTTCARS